MPTNRESFKFFKMSSNIIEVVLWQDESGHRMDCSQGEVGRKGERREWTLGVVCNKEKLFKAVSQGRMKG